MPVHALIRTYIYISTNININMDICIIQNANDYKMDKKHLEYKKDLKMDKNHINMIQNANDCKRIKKGIQKYFYYNLLVQTTWWELAVAIYTCFNKNTIT